eukprot:Colp12_sorted_trinity150504_noHs@1421
MSASERLHEIFKNHWEWRLNDSPEFATAIGEYHNSFALEKHTLDSYEERKLHYKQLAKLLEHFPEHELNKEDRLSLLLFKEEVSNYLSGVEFGSHMLCLNNLEGPQIDFVNVISWSKFEDLQDYKNYLSRLFLLPQQLSEITVLIKRGLALRLFQPAVSISGVEKQLRTHAETPATESAFYKPFINLPAVFTEQEAENLRRQGADTIAKHVIPGFAKFLKFFLEDYSLAARAAVGCRYFPNGEARYQACLRFHTTTNMTPEEIHKLGLAEVMRVQGEMEAVKQEAGFDGSLQQWMASLKNDPQYYFSDKNDLLNGYRDLCKKIDALLPKFFGHLPRAPYEVVETPAVSAPTAPAAFYYNPSADGKRPGCFYVNCHNLAACPSYEMESLALHEAVPGHHLQTAIAMEAEGLPSFRRFIEDRRYYEVPGRSLMHTAYLEGWALYCEWLGQEMGFYQTPAAKFGRLSNEVWRACRLVVDTGLHALGWTREEAISFLESNSGVSAHHARTEVDRYITWPGQACAYKVGEISIKRMRKRAEEALGARFDIRKFHDVILASGPVPLHILDTIVDEHIAAQLN